MMFISLLLVCAIAADMPDLDAKLALLEAKLESMQTAHDAHTAELRELRAKLENNTKREMSAPRGDETAPRDDELGELRIFGIDSCPPGYEEVNTTRGFMLVSRPEGGKALQTLNTALKAGEKYRVGPHSHTATVHDPGHSHTIVCRFVS